MFPSHHRASLALMFALLLTACGQDYTAGLIPAPGQSVVLDVSGNARGYSAGKSAPRSKAGEPESVYRFRLSGAVQDYLALEASLSWTTASDRFALDLLGPDGELLARDGGDT